MTSKLSKWYGKEKPEAKVVVSVAPELPEFVKPFYNNGRVKLGWSHTWTAETVKVREWLKANGWEYHASGRGYYPRGA